MKSFLVSVGCVLLTSALGAAPRPNVLFIVADDLRPELGCYGKSHIVSPNIDQLAAGGIQFDRAYCQQAVCNPSRASMMTGLRPDSTGVHNNGTHFRAKVPEVVTLPQHFKLHGYHAQAFGKIYHGLFETAYVGRKLDDDPSWNVPIWQAGPRFYFTPRGVEIAREAYAREAGKQGAAVDEWTEAFVRGLVSEAPDVPDSTLYDGQITDCAIQTLRELRSGRKAPSPAGDRPFFLAVGYLRPHVPFVAPKKYWDLYDPAKIVPAANDSPPQGAPPFALTEWRDVRNYHGIPKEGPLTRKQAIHLRHGYYACVSFVDAQVGRLLGELDRLRLRDNTIVVFWGDHGWHLGEHGLWNKDTNFEDATRVPLIVRGPGAVTGRSAALVELVDVYPTLCELASLPLPSPLEGTSFVSLLKAPARPWKSAAFSQYPRPGLMGRTMRTDGHRLTIWHATKDPNDIKAVELYDHRSDPAENVNVAGQPGNAALVKQLTLQLRRGWREARPKF